MLDPSPSDRSSIRIALIAGTYDPDRCGVAHYTAHLRAAIAHQGIASIVLTTQAAATAAADPQVRGVVRDWHLADLLPLVRAIQATDVDLLHIQHAAGTYGFDRSLFLLPLLLRLTGWRAPIVTTVHEYGWWEWQPGWLPARTLEALKTWGQRRGWWDREDGFLLTHSDAIIATNGDALRVIRERLPQIAGLYSIPIAANVDVAAVDRTSARAQLRQTCGWSDEVAIIAFFGFLHPVKGLETLLPAFQQVIQTQPQARLLLVGGVESLALRGEDATRYWHQLHARIAELGLQNQVHLTGYLDPTAVSHRLAAADIGVLPFNHGVTLKSGSLLTLLTHGLPVIATCANPTDPELAQQAIAKFVAPRDRDQLANALLTLLQDAALRQQLGRAGFQFSRRFAWPTIAQAHLEVYQSVLNAAPVPLSRSAA